MYTPNFYNINAAKCPAISPAHITGSEHMDVEEPIRLAGEDGAADAIIAMQTAITYQVMLGISTMYILTMTPSSDVVIQWRQPHRRINS